MMFSSSLRGASWSWIPPTQPLHAEFRPCILKLKVHAEQRSQVARTLNVLAYTLKRGQLHFANTHTLVDLALREA